MQGEREIKTARNKRGREQGERTKKKKKQEENQG
jgi:hypothetical protein